MKKMRLTDLAEAAGCSVATVSRALHDSPLISRATKARIHQIARMQGYHLAYDGADDLPSAQPRLAILIGASALQGSSFYSPSSQDLIRTVEPVLAGLVRAALNSPCSLQICHLASVSATSLDAILSDLDADGYLVFGHADLRETLSRQIEKGAAKTQARLLFWGEAVPGQVFESIGPDNFAIGATAVTHLASTGCRRIAYLGDTQGADMGRRFMGYLTALNEAGLKFDSTLILSTPEEALAATFDGLFVADEGLPVTALGPLRAAGRRIPADLRVVAYHNEAPIFPMETVSIDPLEAARRILVRLFGPGAKSEPAFENLPVMLRALTPA